MIPDPLPSLVKQFEYYKLLGEQSFAQLNADQINYKPDDESNSISTIVKHMHGNMISRWTDCLNTDGEKPGRNRDREFEHENFSFGHLEDLWAEGWQCFLSALRNFTTEDLSREILIRNQAHTLLDAINRQLAHYPYHVGQMVFISKMLCGKKWKSLSIPKGGSTNYNDKKFSTAPHKEHFTDEYLDKKKQ